MTWDYNRKVASFITAKDPAICLGQDYSPCVRWTYGAELTSLSKSGDADGDAGNCGCSVSNWQ